MRALTICIALLACDDLAVGVPDAGEAGLLADETPAEVFGAYLPAGCEHVVRHPAGIVDVRPSHGLADDAPRGLHLTFPSEDAGRNVAVSWSTDARTRASVVRLGEAPEALDRTVRGHSFTWFGLEGRVQHEVHLCGLEPGRTYYYRAGGEGAWSEVGSFSTAPPPGSPEGFKMAVVGDTRSLDYAVWGEVVRRVAGQGVDLLLFTGDAVALGTVQAQWDGWFDAPQPALASLPLVPTNGNHDLLAVPYLGQLALPGGEDHFALRYGDALVVSMDDTDPEAGAPFLERALGEGLGAKWRILLNHRSFYSAANFHGQTAAVVAAWLPIVDRRGVELVLNGHDHNYERSKPLRGGEVVGPGEGTVYVVSAGGGAPLYESGVSWWTEISESVGNYAVVEVTPAHLRLTAHRLDGTVIDRFELRK